MWFSSHPERCRGSLPGSAHRQLPHGGPPPPLQLHPAQLTGGTPPLVQQLGTGLAEHHVPAGDAHCSAAGAGTTIRHMHTWLFCTSAGLLPSPKLVDFPRTGNSCFDAWCLSMSFDSYRAGEVYSPAKTHQQQVVSQCNTSTRVPPGLQQRSRQSRTCSVKTMIHKLYIALAAS